MMEAYHDDEWGRPVRTERGLFEKVCLEGFQAGLSWRTVLIRREALRLAFAGFDPDVLANWSATDLDDALHAEGMLRHRGKIASVVTNARATIALREGAGLVELIWSHQPVAARAPRSRAPTSMAEVPAVTPESTALAVSLRSAGFTFVGPTTAYALMQADGLVNDHFADCPVRASVEADRVQLA